MEGIKYSGALSVKETMMVLPNAERLRKGPVAILECLQEIPCNPCEIACPFGAITVGYDITALPRIDREKCTACGVCISKCPGLAIFVVDGSAEDGTATVAIPYEYLPLPSVGEGVDGLDRTGRYVAKSRVKNVDNGKYRDGTTVVTLSVPVEHLNSIRSFRRVDSGEVLLCRCSEVTEKEVRQAIREGASTVAAVKNRTRAGMGLCQGRTCRRLIARIIADETGQAPTDILPPTSRPPVRTVPLSALAGGEDDE